MKTMKTVKTILLLCVLFVSGHHAASVNAATAGHSEKAPEFELKDMQGVKHRLSEYRGKVVLINFWASWCRECLTEMPSLNSLYEKFKDKGVVVIGVSTDINNEDIKKSVKKTRVTYPILVDSEGEVFQQKYAVLGLPTTVIVDKKGFIAERILGSFDFGSPVFMKKIKMLTEGK